MPKRILLAAIGFTRNGQTVYPPIGDATNGEPFDLTNEELAQIEAIEKRDDVVMLRALRNEGTDSAAPAAATKAAATTAPAASTVAPTEAPTFTVANTGAELKAEATKRGLDFSTLKSKADLVALLDANPAKPAEPSGEQGDDEDL